MGGGSLFQKEAKPREVPPGLAGTFPPPWKVPGPRVWAEEPSVLEAHSAPPLLTLAHSPGLTGLRRGRQVN